MTDTAQDDEEKTIYLIPAENLDKFEKEIGKLSRKSERFGIGPIKPWVFGYQMKNGTDGHEHKYLEVYLTADPVKVDGWSFVATLDHSVETGTIIRSVPNAGVAVPDEYRTAEPHCDHCKVRRFRRDTYVLHCAATGEFKQVGKTCLQDFFGHDPLKIARMAEYLGFADECARGLSDIDFAMADRRFISVAEFAGHCAAMVRLHGWVSRSNANSYNSKMHEDGNPYGKEGLIATTDRAFKNMFPTPHDLTYGFVREKVTDEDKKVAEAALEWAESLKDKANKSDYEHNICAIAGAAVIEMRATGLAASIVGVFVRNSEREVERRAQREALKESQHIGKEKERLRDLSVTVLGHFARPSDFGTTHIYRFSTTGENGGNVLVWFASTNQGIQVGDSVKITGTVVKHGEFEGVKNTVLNRCKVEK